MNDVVNTINCYRTKNQFVQYVFGINHNKAKFGDLDVTHMVIRRVVVTAKAMKEQKVVEEYEFIIDKWYQQEWWLNTLKLVEDMLSSYAKYKLNEPIQALVDLKAIPEQRVISFRKSYGNCESFFKACKFTAHCTSGASQDLQQLGFEQKVYDKNTNSSIPLKEFRTQLGLGV
jgi:hypothetical protein